MGRGRLHWWLLEEKLRGANRLEVSLGRAGQRTLQPRSKPLPGNPTIILHGPSGAEGRQPLATSLQSMHSPAFPFHLGAFPHPAGLGSLPSPESDSGDSVQLTSSE